MKAVLRLAFCLFVALLTVQCTGVRNETLCRVENFDPFLARYSEDVEFQKRNTASALSKRVVENVAPEPRTVEQTLDRSQVSFPVFPSDSRIEADSLQKRVTPDGQRMKVRVSKPDTDYQIDYLFEHRECWQLVRIEDSSL